MGNALRSATDLDRHLTFYCAYHSDSINSAIHVAAIWPILWTFLALLRLGTPTAAPPSLLADMAPPGLFELHAGWLVAAIYMTLYPLMQPVAGTAAAALVFLW